MLCISILCKTSQRNGGTPRSRSTAQLAEENRSDVPVIIRHYRNRGCELDLCASDITFPMCQLSMVPLANHDFRHETWLMWLGQAREMTDAKRILITEPGVTHGLIKIEIKDTSRKWQTAHTQTKLHTHTTNIMKHTHTTNQTKHTPHYCTHTYTAMYRQHPEDTRARLNVYYFLGLSVCAIIGIWQHALMRPVKYLSHVWPFICFHK